MRTPIDRLTSLDQLMLRVSKTWPQDIGALAILDGTNLLEPGGRFRIEAARGDRIQAAPRPSVPAGRPRAAARARPTAVRRRPVLRPQ